MVVAATHHQAALPIRLPTVAHHQAAHRLEEVHHRSEEVHHRLAEAAEALRLVEAAEAHHQATAIMVEAHSAEVADNITQICHIKRIDKDNIGLSNLTTSSGKEACGRL